MHSSKYFLECCIGLLYYNNKVQVHLYEFRYLKKKTDFIVNGSFGSGLILIYFIVQSLKLLKCKFATAGLSSPASG